MKRWRISDELKYAMILKAFEARPFSIAGRRSSSGIGERDAASRLLYIIGEVL